MTKTEFLSKLESALRKNGIADTADILSEYEEHFAFKTADGYSEEEIAARLGSPSELARQFEKDTPGEKRGGRILTTALGLGFIDLFAAVGFLFLWAWEAVMAAAPLSFAAISVCLLGNLHGEHIQMPYLPYGCALIFGIALGALAVLSAVGFLYAAACICQLMRSFARFHRNAMASAAGRPVLPPVPASPRLPAKTRRVLRRLALISLVVFAAAFVLGALVSMFAARAVEFWHAWGWFGYPG